MADLVTTIDKKSVFGDMRVHIGTWVNAGTGGEVLTGLRSVVMFTATLKGSSVIADTVAVNETLPTSGTTGGEITVVTTNGSETYYYMAIGY